MAVYDVNGNKILSGSGGIPLFYLLSANSLIKHQAGNSSSAFSTAYANGYQMMEGDVQFTSDNVPIMCHDASIGGLTIATHTLAELQAATTIYTLDNWLLDCKKYNVFADIDFTKTYTSSQCATLVQHISDAGMTNRVSIECGVSSSAPNLVANSEELILNILGASTTSAIDSFATIAAKCKLVIATIPHADATKALVTYVHGKGYLAKIWTGTSSDTKAMVEGYLNMGADQVLCDTVKPSDITP